MAAFRICFVCTGNICRSPTAAALLLARVRDEGRDLVVDSCGLSAEELGNPADRRAIAEARRRGIAMPPHRARQLGPADYEGPGWLVGMTRAHVQGLERRRPAGAIAETHLLLDFVPGRRGQDVPDPWYGDERAFVHAFDLVAAGVDGLVRALDERAFGRRG
jgi:protein-tyrosine phosphatase